MGRASSRRRFGSEELNFRFGHIKFEMSTRHSSIDGAKAIGYMSLEFRGKSWEKNKDMIVIIFYIVLGAISLEEFVKAGSLKRE